MGNHLRSTKYAGENRRGDYRSAHTKQAAECPCACTQCAQPWPGVAELSAARLCAQKNPQQRVGCQDQKKADERDAHSLGVQRDGDSCAGNREAEARSAQRQRVAEVDAVALVIAPDSQEHIGHDHNQSCALRHLLIQPEEHANDRNGDEAPADAKQPS